MSTAYEDKAIFRTYFETPVSVPVLAPHILECGGTRGFVVILPSGGTAVYQACDSTGNFVDGSVSHSMTSEAIVDTFWTFVLITSTTHPCMVARV